MAGQRSTGPLRNGGAWNWFSDLPEPAWAALVEACRTTSLPAGSAVYRQGDPATALYQVTSGRVHVYTLTADGRELLYAHLGPGDCFGELGLLDGGPSHHHADAVQATTLACLSAAALDALRSTHPDIDRALLRLLARRTRAVYAVLEGASLQDVEQRLAGRLLAMLPEAASGPDGPSTLACSQDELARMIGSSRQSVSALLKRWAADGVVAVGYGKVTIKDRARLTRLASL